MTNTFPSAAAAGARRAPRIRYVEVWAGAWSVCFAIESEEFAVSFDFADGRACRPAMVEKMFALAAPRGDLGEVSCAATGFLHGIITGFSR